MARTARDARPTARVTRTIAGVALWAVLPTAAYAQSDRPVGPPAGSGTVDFQYVAPGTELLPPTLLRLLFRDGTVRQEVRIAGQAPMLVELTDLRDGSGVLLRPAQRTLMVIPPDDETPSAPVDSARWLTPQPGVDTVAGVPCARWRTPSGAGAAAELCLASAAAMGLAPDVARFLTRTAMGMVGGDGPLAVPPRAGVLVPVRIRLRDGTTRLDLVRHDARPVDAALFAIPPGYTERPPRPAPR